MSEDIAVSSKNDEQSSNQAVKRRKRSGWDVQTPTVESSIPTITNNTTNLHQPLLQNVPQMTIPPMHLGLTAPLTVATPSIVPSLLAAAPSLGGLLAQAPKMGCRIYIGSINYDIKESDMIALFSSFGTITKSEMSIDPITGKSKGFCFIEYSDPTSAEAAQAMDGFELAGRKMKVGRPFHGEGAVPVLGAPSIPGLQPGMMMLGGAAMGGVGIAPNPLSAMGITAGLGGLPLTSIPAASYGLPMMNNPLQMPAFEDKKNCLLVSNVKPDTQLKDLEKIFSAFGSTAKCMYIPDETTTTTAAGEKTKKLIVEYGDTAHAFSTSMSMNNFELGGFSLKCEVISGSTARQLLQPKVVPVVTTSTTSSSSGNTIATNDYKVLLLNNMITIEDTKDPELKDEINEEASNYGELDDIQIIANESEQTAIVKLYFKDTVSAGKAYKAMNNRTFGTNKISAVLVPE